jgi:hypothetical protein
VLFQFNGESFFFETGATRFTASQCKTALEALRNVAEVDCTITASTDFLVTYQIVFRKFPVLPYENNIFSHDGNPALSSFSCNTDQIVNAGRWDDITCTIGELNTDRSYPGKRCTLRTVSPHLRYFWFPGRSPFSLLSLFFLF